MTNRGWFRFGDAGDFLVSLLNTGNAPVDRVSVVIGLAHGLFPLHVGDGRWHCFVNMAVQREICWYQRPLLPWVRTELVLPERVAAPPGSYLVGLAHAGADPGHSAFVNLGLAHGLVPVCSGEHHQRGCSMNLHRHGKLCSCRNLRLPELSHGHHWPGGAQHFPGYYRPGSYLVSLDGPGGAFGHQLFMAGDFARSGGVCGCRGVLLPELHATLILPDMGHAPDGSFPVVRPAFGSASGVSPEGQVADVTQVQPH